jgi:uncharacterized protein YndB with AHSA1/START domain
MYTIMQQALIPAAVRQTWWYITDPGALSQWFADTQRFTAGEPCRFDFGDGDFFTGRVVEWRPETLLRLHWKFMGLGPEYEIRYALRPVGDATEVSVQDRGARTQTEAEGLHEGWADFLSRLERYARLGTSTRYVWSQTIGVTALLCRTGTPLPALLADVQGWVATLPGLRLTASCSDTHSVTLHWQDEAWEGATTQAIITIEQSGNASYVTVTHDGWVQLPSDQQIAERRRFAGLWRQALCKLEANDQCP